MHAFGLLVIHVFSAISGVRKGSILFPVMFNVSIVIFLRCRWRALGLGCHDSSFVFHWVFILYLWHDNKIVNHWLIYKKCKMNALSLLYSLSLTYNAKNPIVLLFKNSA
jgi:hypothetical protein